MNTMMRKIGALKLTAVSMLFVIISTNGFAQDLYLLAGTYTGTGSKGIYVYRFNTATGKTAWISNTDTASNPSFLTVSGNYVYAVNETSGSKPGQVSAYKFDKEKGTLQLLNTQLTGGGNPCYLSLSPEGKWLTVANYSGGSLSVFPVNKDGSLQPCAQLILHTGNSINTKRQSQAHVHETVFSPDSKYLFTPDLGMDKVMTYQFDAGVPQPLSAASTNYTIIKPGSGPRHIVFSANKKYAYLINELSGMVIVYNYNKGELSEIQELPTYPEGFKGAVDGAEICLAPDGKFLYTSQRADENLISIFSIDKHSGKLKIKEQQPAFGKGPRNFMIDPTGNYLLVAHQNSDNIVIFKRDKKSGLLTNTGDEIKVPKPVCLVMTKTE